MKLSSRCIPLGSLPYENIESTTKMAAKLFEKMPYIPVLPKVSPKDSIVGRTLQNIPGVRITDSGKVVFKPTKETEEAMIRLDKAFNDPVKSRLDEFGFEAPFLEKYLQMIKKFKPSNACINILGPFSLSQMLMDAADAHVLADKNYRKLFIQAICVKAIWLIEKIKEQCPETEPLVILEEPYFGRFGEVKRQNEEVTVDIVTNMFTKVTDKIKSAGGYVGVHCAEKCNWQIPINAGIDLISFDAYTNPNNLSIIPDTIIDFISRGGKINWAIVPVMTESIVKSLNVEYLRKRLLATLDGLVMAGVPINFVYNSAVVSVQGDMAHLPLIFAEKALILSTQLAKKIPIVS